MTVKLTKQGKIALVLLVMGFAFLGNFAFAKWEKTNADAPDYSAASAAEFLGVEEVELIHFDYKVGTHTLPAYAVQTDTGIQVALPEFDYKDDNNWKWNWLRDTTLSDAVHEAIENKK